MRKAVLTSLFLVFFSTLLIAEKRDTVVDNPQPVLVSEVDRTPQFRGVLRTRFEHDLNDNLSRFSVRNARVVMAGSVTQKINYLLQVDLSENGTFRVLDLEVRMNPTENLSLRIGQGIIPFYHLHMIAPSQVLFAERALACRFMTGHLRDIGIIADYRLSAGSVPIVLSGAVFNGAGINNPEWRNISDFGYAFRVMIGSFDNVRLSFRTHHSTVANNVRNRLYAIDFRYFNNGFAIDTEIISANFISPGVSDRRLGWCVQTSQIFRTDRQILNYIEPAVRWDMMAAEHGRWSDANRLTLGVNFGFNQIYRRTQLRLNYEMYFVNEDRTAFYFGVPGNSHDRIILELRLNF
ncbi:MAG: porin [Bacteroidales bacterium]|nr:porin [Bacteroidales bacterium]